MALRAAGRQRQNRIAPIQRLNRRLFIDAEDRRVLRRIQIEPDDLGGFGFEIGIGRAQIAFQAMRLEAAAFPRPRHDGVGHVELRREAAGRPVRCAIRGGLAGPAQNPGFELRRQDAGFRSAMPPAQALDPVGHIPSFPCGNGLQRARGSLTDRHVGVAIGQHQNDPCAATLVSAAAPRTRQGFERVAIVRGQGQWSGGLHVTYVTTLEMISTVH